MCGSSARSWEKPFPSPPCGASGTGWHDHDRKRAMRRRLTLTFVGAVAVALVVSGLVPLLLVARFERQRAETEVTRQAVDLATDAERLNRPAAVQSLARVLHLSDLGVVRVGPRGAVVGSLPSGIRATDIHPDRLLAGAVVHGRSRRLVYAAAPVPTARAGAAAVVATRHVGLLPGVTGYFLLSSVLALGLAALVGNQLGGVIVRPLQDAETATRRIADG